MKIQIAKKSLLIVLTLIGCATVLYLTALSILHVVRNGAPDKQTELLSPLGPYRIVITEQLAGFPGSVCIKQVYVLPARAKFDRNDTDNEIFTGACDGLVAVNWTGDRVEGDIVFSRAADGVKSQLKSYGADGQVKVIWAAH